MILCGGSSLNAKVPELLHRCIYGKTQHGMLNRYLLVNIKKILQHANYLNNPQSTWVAQRLFKVDMIDKIQDC